jgi:tetratricopeptide (TPR) repeat protein
VGEAPVVALRLAAGLFWFWYFRGHLSEGREWMERALTAGPVDEDALRAKVMYQASALAWSLGDYAAASSWAEEALRIARSRGDAEVEAWALLNLGVGALMLGDLNEGARLNTEALERFRDSGQPWAVPYALSNLGAAAARAEKPEEAERYFTQALREARESGNRLFASFVLVSLGYFPLQRGDLQQAGEMFDEALVTSREFGYRRNEARALHGLADVAEAKGNPDQAEAHIRAGEAIYRDLGDTAALVALLDARGYLLLRQGHVPRALEAFEAALVLARTKLEVAIAPCLYNLGDAHRAAGEFAAAATCYRESLELALRTEDHATLAHNLVGLARMGSVRNKHVAAARLLSAAAPLHDPVMRAESGHDHSGIEQDVAEVRAALGESDFTAAWEAGRALPLEEAVAEALALADELGRESSRD